MSAPAFTGDCRGPQHQRARVGWARPARHPQRRRPTIGGLHTITRDLRGTAPTDFPPHHPALTRNARCGDMASSCRSSYQGPPFVPPTSR
ncbi:hypothetical protein ACU686_16445 [Yinghuangia aomiensis]